MSYEYDGNGGLQPAPPKKNDNDLGAWIFIAVMFAVAWPVGLILLLMKLSEGGKKKVRRQTARSDAAQKTVQQVTRTPEYSARSGKIMKAVGAVLGIVGALFLLRQLDFTLGYAIEYGEWMYLLRQIFYPVGMLAGGASLLLGSGVIKRRQRRFATYLRTAGQKQAVPLMVTEAPIVATGIEHKCAVDSEVCITAKGPGVITRVSATNISVSYDDGNTADYTLTKFARSNQGTCINQRPVVDVGEHLEKGAVIADGASTKDGEIALGKNILIGFMTWEGYNYEDAVLISEQLVRDDVYTSLHIEEHETEARDTKQLGAEEITRDIPNVGEEALKDLDERGIIRIGAEVHSGDILVGKVTPKGETELTAEERLLRAIFGEKAREVRDTSLRVPHGEGGVVVDVRIFSRENKDELSPGVHELVRVYIAQKRKISVGDKMAGRHGNKGVISRILPEEDMPFLPDGTPLQIVLNPMGVPSRMNIGQILELHLGKAAKGLNMKVATPVLDGAGEDDIKMLLAMSNKSNKPMQDLMKMTAGDVLKLIELADSDPVVGEKFREAYKHEDGKTVLYDGRSGEPFENRVSVGYMYYLKLHHLVDDKIHARSTGPYSLVTQQPLGGKAQFGGQRFGEMEVWALEAYGAAYTLQEILTVKSDDVVGRVKTYEAIVKGNNVPKPGIPESFKVLVKELQSLCLDVSVLDADGEEIDLKQTDEELGFAPSDDKAFSSVNDAGTAGGYGTENEEGDIFNVGSGEDDDDSADFADDAEGEDDYYDGDIFSDSEGELDDYDD